jgi:hypothetical protein
MYDYLPDYFLREQNAVGALFAFLAIRYAMLSFGMSRSLRASTINAIYAGLVGMFCLPQLADLLVDGTVGQMAGPILQGKLLGCALAYFGASALYRTLRQQS